MANAAYDSPRALARSAVFEAVDRLPIARGERIGRVAGCVPSLHAWLRAQGRDEDYRIIRAAHEVKREAPRPRSVRHAHGFNPARYTAYPEHFAATLRQPYVLARNGTVLTEDRKLVLESITSRKVLRGSSVLERSLWPPVERLSGDYTVPYQQYSNDNYGLWFFEVLPRIKPFLEAPHEGVGILLPPRPTSWQRSSLEALGVSEERLHAPDGGQQVQVERLHFVSKPGLDQNTPRWVAQWLREQFSPDPPALNASEKKRLYLSRSCEDTRRVVNEDVVLNLLDGYGFETVHPETMSFREQRRLFRNAGMLVAPHGAGNANILFAHDLAFIELFDPTYVKARYYTVAEALGHEYRYLVSSETDDVWREDIIVDCSRLERLLESLLQGNEHA